MDTREKRKINSRSRGDRQTSNLLKNFSNLLLLNKIKLSNYGLNFPFPWKEFQFYFANITRTERRHFIDNFLPASIEFLSPVSKYL